MRSMPFWLRAATWARCAKTSSAVNLVLLGPAKQENAKHRSSRFLASKDALRAVWIVSNAICVVCHHTSFSNAVTAAACGLPGLFFMMRCAAASAPSSVRMKSMAGCRVSCGPKRGARVKGRQTLYMACDQHLQLSHAKKNLWNSTHSATATETCARPCACQLCQDPPRLVQENGFLKNPALVRARWFWVVPGGHSKFLQRFRLVQHTQSPLHCLQP